MSKGNMLLGYARGKVGSLVFARRKGEQITRARNFAPANPRTNAQLSQRMKMYAPVQLYKQSMRRFFKYAFPIKSRETIFNAYMRENIALAPWTSRQLADAQAPIPFPARMSAGSLGSIPTVVLAERPEGAVDGAFLFPGTTNSTIGFAVEISSEALTVGELSTALMTKYTSLAVGDQITFVIAGTAGLSLESGDVLYNDTDPFIFNYAKFKINPTSNVSVSSLGFMASETAPGVWGVSIVVKDISSEACVGGCVIVTRSEGANIVDASNTSLVLNGNAMEVYNLMRTESYREKAAASYKVTADAYLNPATTEV